MAPVANNTQPEGRKVSFMLYLVEVIQDAAETEYRKFAEKSLAVAFADRKRDYLETLRKRGEIIDYIVITYQAI